MTCGDELKSPLLDLRRAICLKVLGTGQTHSERAFLRVLVLGVCPKRGSQRDAGPAMGQADNTVGLDAGKRTLLSNSHRKTNCSLGPLFFFCGLDSVTGMWVCTPRASVSWQMTLQQRAEK